MPSFTDPIVAVTISAGHHTGITLFAPLWTDADDEEWTGFLGDGAKIVLAGTPQELQDWIGDHPDHDLADHPAWSQFVAGGLEALTPSENAHYDFEAVYELAAGDPSVESVSLLADAIDMAGSIADCCEDGGLRALLNGNREYRLLVEGDISYTTGKAGAQEWIALGNTIAESWSRALGRIEFWLNWQGSTQHPAEAAAAPADQEAGQQSQQQDRLAEDSAE